MKKFIKIFLFIIVIFTTGCSNEETRSALEFTEIRISYGIDFFDYQHLKISNIEEFENTLNAIDFLDRKSIDLDRYSEYDNNFFDSYFLFTDFIYNSSSSIKLIIDSYNYDGDSLTLCIKRVSPDLHTADIGTTMVLFEVPKNNLADSDIEINVIYL